MSQNYGGRVQNTRYSYNRWPDTNQYQAKTLTVEFAQETLSCARTVHDHLKDQFVQNPVVRDPGQWALYGHCPARIQSRGVVGTVQSASWCVTYDLGSPPGEVQRSLVLTPKWVEISLSACFVTSSTAIVAPTSSGNHDTSSHLIGWLTGGAVNFRIIDTVATLLKIGMFTRAQFYGLPTFQNINKGKTIQC